MSLVNTVAFIIFVLLVVLISLQVFRRKISLKTHSGFAEIKDPDVAVVEQLKNCGADLSKKHEIEFFFYFPSREDAALAASELVGMDFDTDISETETFGQWLCLATKQLVPDPDILAGLRHQFEELAIRFDGEYDGWGTGVVK